MTRIQLRNGSIQLCDGSIALDDDVCCEDCKTCNKCYHAACDPCRAISELTVEIVDVAEPNGTGNAYCYPSFVACDCDNINSAYVLDVAGTGCFASFSVPINNPCGPNERDNTGECEGGRVQVSSCTVKVRLIVNNAETTYSAHTFGSVIGVGSMWFFDDFTLPVGHFVAVTIDVIVPGFPISFFYLYSFTNLEDGKYKCSLMTGGTAPLTACSSADPFCELGGCTPGSFPNDARTIFCNVQDSSIDVSSPIFLAPGGTC